MTHRESVRSEAAPGLGDTGGGRRYRASAGCEGRTALDATRDQHQRAWPMRHGGGNFE